MGLSPHSASDRSYSSARTDAGDKLPRRRRASAREKGARGPCLPLPRVRSAGAAVADRVDAVGPRERRAGAHQLSPGVERADLRHGPLGAELISTGRATVRLNTNACWVDALALLESSSSHASRADLAVLCAGDLLEGFDEVSKTFAQWLARERIRLKERLSGSLDVVLLERD